jgi:hypothetical protein
VGQNVDLPCQRKCETSVLDRLNHPQIPEDWVIKYTSSNYYDRAGNKEYF